MSLSKNETILSGGEVVPQSRIEKILVGEDIEPQSRIEALLKEKLCGGGGSVPKPLTYDYMPEGYPKKTMGTVTLMEEQELAFALAGDSGQYVAQLTKAFEFVEGQTYTVNWDGTEYTCVGFVSNSMPMIGNLSILSMSESDNTGEPFLCYNNGNKGGIGTLDTAASHTISIKTTAETVTPMAEEFLPSEVNELIMNSATQGSAKKFKITVNDSGTISATEVT